MHQHATLEDTVYFGFGANLTSGTAGDGATPLFDVRLGGAAAGAAPVLSGTPTLLTHANYTDGCYEVAIAATAVNGFAAGNTYLVFVSLTIDSVTPAACIGSFRLAPIPANVTQWLGTACATPTVAGVPEVDLTHVAGATTNVAALATNVDAILTDTAVIGTPAGATIAADLVVIDNFVDGIEASLAAGVVLADASSDAVIADAVWNAATATYGGAGSYGLLIETDLDAAVSSRASQTSVDTVDNFIDTEITDIQNRLPAALVGGRMDASVGAVANDTDAVTRLERVLSGNVTGTVGAASTTTSIVTSAMDPAAAVTDQFKGRILTFDAATTTTNLRGQSTDITASTALGVLTVTALTHAPVSGDTFTVS